MQKNVRKEKTGRHYTDELSAWATGRKAGRGRKRVAFLAIRDDVEDAIRHGFPVRTIWEHMQETGRTDCCYETFARHVRLFIRKRPEKPEPEKAFRYDPVIRTKDLF